MVNHYLAQDNENQFDSLFFRGGRYQRETIIIPKIQSVSGIKEMDLNKGYSFTVWLQDTLRKDFTYESEEKARKDRNDLLFQIERFWKNKNREYQPE